jgi:A/G-specific adenine glycosylase
MSEKRLKFAELLIGWQRKHGRHDLPWQKRRDPYLIWVSEIMLQQTQVATAVPFYLRFIRRFPNIAALASASLDEVMKHWAGLGYYARCRNLHSTANIVFRDLDGLFPRTAEQLNQLPGVGRSTAAAIAVFSYGARAAILDANVKRVLARCFAIEGNVNSGPVASRLWALAERLLPLAKVEEYSQGLMDLGAIVCTRAKPKCKMCPLQNRCRARRTGMTAELPARKALPAKRSREIHVVLVRDKKNLLLVKRPAAGIWGGLWSLPEVAHVHDVSDELRRRFGLTGDADSVLSGITHELTHLSLHIVPIVFRVVRANGKLKQTQQHTWVTADSLGNFAVPAPISKLLKTQLQQSPAGHTG